jgi:hypothetical protein
VFVVVEIELDPIVEKLELNGRDVDIDVILSVLLSVVLEKRPNVKGEDVKD